MAMLAVESQQVIALRMMKLAGGGSRAGDEARRMVAEKFFAAAQASNRLMVGGTVKQTIRGYRKRVRANARRLSR